MGAEKEPGQSVHTDGSLKLSDAAERIRFTRSGWDRGIRVGNLAAIEQIHEDGGLSVRVDSGVSLQLTPEEAQHVEYGYAIESTERLAIDRVFLSGKAEQILLSARHSLSFRLKLHELTVYTSQVYQPTSPESALQKSLLLQLLQPSQAGDRHPFH